MYAHSSMTELWNLKGGEEAPVLRKDGRPPELGLSVPMREIQQLGTSSSQLEALNQLKQYNLQKAKEKEEQILPRIYKTQMDKDARKAIGKNTFSQEYQSEFRNWNDVNHNFSGARAENFNKKLIDNVKASAIDFRLALDEPSISERELIRRLSEQNQELLRALAQMQANSHLEALKSFEGLQKLTLR